MKNGAFGAFRLHSHSVNYGTGSGQQSVTGYNGRDDPNSLWLVKGPHGKDCVPGTAVAKGATIRLEHHATGKNLHSHLHSSPLSKQQEVSCYGENNTGDTGDNWEVRITTDYWMRGAEVRFQHSDTGKWLSMTGNAFGSPIHGQKEIVCSQHNHDQAKWSTEEGFYFPRNKEF
uniref:MIR domain-containing protein n=1 Tax=Arcella intermedia TaxID=1963864 RepID=A0A6B2LLK6_9EUKA